MFVYTTIHIHKHECVRVTNHLECRALLEYTHQCFWLLEFIDMPLVLVHTLLSACGWKCDLPAPPLCCHASAIVHTFSFKLIFCLFCYHSKNTFVFSSFWLYLYLVYFMHTCRKSTEVLTCERRMCACVSQVILYALLIFLHQCFS